MEKNSPTLLKESGWPAGVSNEIIDLGKRFTAA